MSKPELIVFSENVLGGIQNFCHNLLRHIDQNKFEIKWFLINHKYDDRAPAPAFTFQNKIINYNNIDRRWKKALTISKFISNQPGVIVANREFELDCLLLYPKTNKLIIFVVHDDYYLQFAEKYSEIISVFIAHNKFIYNELIKILPNRIKEIYFLPFGIQLSPYKRIENLEKQLNIAFIARLDILKGIYDLNLIDDILRKNNVNVNWIVIGDGPEKKRFLASILSKNNFNHYQAKDDLDIFSKIKNCDLFILPSLRDGTPLALLESMSAGLVPIIYEFNEGIKEIVTEDIGFITKKQDYKKMSEIILFLDKNRLELEKRSLKATKMIINNFDVKKRTQDYESLFLKYSFIKPKKFNSPKYTSILDNPYIPAKIINFFNKFKK